MKTFFSIVVSLLLSFHFAFAGDLKGIVTFKGMPPAPQPIQITKDTRICGLHKELHKVIVDSRGGLQDVVVRIIEIKSTSSSTGPEPVLNQKNCEFVPSVVAVPVGGSLTITSQDLVLHNTHALTEDGSTAFNYAVPIKGMKLHWKATTPGKLRVKCDAGHTWMSASIVVTDNPYFAITGADGSFIIRDVPAGTYQVEAWHPALGKLMQTVNVGTRESNVNFQFTAK